MYNNCSCYNRTMSNILSDQFLKIIKKVQISIMDLKMITQKQEKIPLKFLPYCLESVM